MGSELVEPASQVSYTEMFYEYFPFYLAIGMSCEQYWDADCQLVKYYRKAYEIKKKLKNEELWLQGAYIYDALCAVAPILHAFAKKGTKPLPYLTKPYSLTIEKQSEEDKKQQEKLNRQKAKAIFEAWANSLNLPKKDGER